MIQAIIQVQAHCPACRNTFNAPQYEKALLVQCPKCGTYAPVNTPSPKMLTNGRS